MKKKYLIIIATITVMSLCLSLVGCGKSSPDSSSDSESAGQSQVADMGDDDSSIDDEEGGKGCGPETETGKSNLNGKRNADGSYTYIVRGKKIKLDINIDDYIQKGSEFTRFDLETLAADYGYTYMYNLDGMYLGEKDDGTEIIAGFQHHTNDDSTDILYRSSLDPQGDFRCIRYQYFNTEEMDLKYHMHPINREFVILVAYVMQELYKNPSISIDPMDEIFSEYKVDEPYIYSVLYVLP